MRTSDSEVSASAKTSARYRYSGPTSGVTLQEGEDVREVMLHTGAEVELPVEHEYTKTLLAPVPDPGRRQGQAGPPARSGADETLQTKGA